MNILIINLHSALNLGDDAIMHETLRGLNATFPGATVIAAANDPDSWRKHKQLDVVGSLTTWTLDREHHEWRWKKWSLLLYTCLLACAAVMYRLRGRKLLFGRPEQRKLLQAYYDADLVISCGGGNFYAHRRFSVALIWSLFTLAFALVLGKKTCLLPQSIGPIPGRFQRILARLVFSHVDRILLREPISRGFLRELQVSKAAVVLPDLAFGLPKLSEIPEVGSTLPSAPLRIGVTMLDRVAQEPLFAFQQQYEDAVVSTLIEYATLYSAHIYLFVQCYGPTRDQDDRLMMQRIHSRLVQHTSHVMLLDRFEDAVAIKTMYQQMDCVIGTRMHTGIFALSSGVPTLLIAYQPKASGVMELFGLERYCCYIETVTHTQLSELMSDILSHQDDLRIMIDRRSTELRAMLSAWPSYLQN